MENNINNLEILRHSTSHVMAQAVKRLFSDVKIAIGPAINEGFYYDFELSHRFVPEDLPLIEKEMEKIIASKLIFNKRTMTKEQAYVLFEKEKEPYKLELIEEIDADVVTIFEDGEFVDLCRGPHLENTGLIKSFKLTHIAGAYWRGDEHNVMLQRIYGTAFFAEDELNNHLLKLEEARKRDHRKIGKQLDLFTIKDEIGPGLVLWHPKGALVRHLIESYWKEEHYRSGYDLVYTPHIGKSDLWEISGHLNFYDEFMYAPMDIEGQKYYIKPMNCPFHIMMYKNKLHSYRELPIRWAELGTVYRYEKSGVLHGLMRVRGFTQDDAHIICTPQQMEDEIQNTLAFCLHVLKSFGFEKYKLYISTQPKTKCVGEEIQWETAQKALETAVLNLKLSYEIDDGGGAFYGPKIDIKIKDALDREWQCSTIQFDFNLPERFEMKYIEKDGSQKRPYMIHRALLGSFERFFGVLVEHYKGAFPVWLSPIQVTVLPIVADVISYAESVLKALKDVGFRSQIDRRNEKIGLKIREAQLDKIPFMVIIGNKEDQEKLISLRHRDKGDLGKMTVDNFISILREDISNKD
ncbi:threonine--tRNA ligase [Chlamydiota bacterium]